MFGEVIATSGKDRLYLARRPYHGHTVVTAIGAITRHTVIQLRTTMLQALARHGPDLILDVGGVDVLDDVGADALRRTATRAKVLGGRLQLVGADRALRRRLDEHGLTWQIRVHDSLAAVVPAESTAGGPDELVAR